MPNPLHRLHELGQSVWLDYIRRGMLENGELRTMMDQFDLRGVTSNPSIFEEAIGKSTDYDRTLEALAGDGTGAYEAYESVVIEDIRDACDILRPVYDAADGHDGFVSIEVNPELAHDTERTLADARRLWKTVDRPNLMVKIPGTDEGVPAIEQALSEGININITLLFSLVGYGKVMEAYLRGLERRAEAGGDVSRVASVASFFVSRVDTAVDAELEEIVNAGGEHASRAKSLLGKAAIANAKLAYQQFREIFTGDRWDRLHARGAKVQRPLWASTSTKNPDYRDVIYIEELIGPHTVNTVPLATLKAFADHGVAQERVTHDLDGARSVLDSLHELGIELSEVTERLQLEGVEKFIKSFRGTMTVVADKLARVAAGR
jgi:transaldolase